MNKDIQMNSYEFDESIYGSHIKIIDSVGKDKKVLDVGCNKGYLAKRFKENGCRVVGIEADHQSAQFAKKFCDEVIIADVEKIEELSYPDNYFDVMVFADILEHLKDPRELLTRLKRYLNPAGFIIVSLPNIARIDIRIKLLFGRFDYEETGILDRTHLRFFTFSTAKKLLEDSGYRVFHADYAGRLAAILTILPEFFAFQFIMIARKAEITK